MPVERTVGGSSLIDVLDRVLDKGIVIDAWVRVSLVGIDLITVEARAAVAGVAGRVRGRARERLPGRGRRAPAAGPGGGRRPAASPRLRGGPGGPRPPAGGGGPGRGVPHHRRATWPAAGRGATLRG